MSRQAQETDRSNIINGHRGDELLLVCLNTFFCYVLKISKGKTFTKFDDLTFAGKTYWAADTKFYPGKAHHPKNCIGI